ncbi:hypothetical protein ACU686_35815 [Yinghuangia aomiensis]
MFYAFGFERVGIVVGDLYFVDPDPIPADRRSPERGVRLELSARRARRTARLRLLRTTHRRRTAALAGRPARVRGRAGRQLRPHPPPPRVPGLGTRQPRLRRGTRRRPPRVARQAAVRPRRPPRRRGSVPR